MGKAAVGNYKYQNFIDSIIGWPLATSGVNDREDFRRELLKYINMLEQDGIFNQTPQNLDKLKVSLGFEKATIIFNYWIDPNKDGHWIEQEKSFMVKLNRSLTEFELLFQIHRESYDILKNQDAHYLEYLKLIGENNDGPIYEMVLGS